MLTPRRIAQQALRELSELGPRGSLFRIGWELRRRSGYFALRERLHGPTKCPPNAGRVLSRSLTTLPLSRADAVAQRYPHWLTSAAQQSLFKHAQAAERGEILLFSDRIANFHQPIDWCLNPRNGQRWDAEAHWARALNNAGAKGDIKLTWEIGRFPQAYLLSRAALCNRVQGQTQASSRCEQTLTSQIESFIAENPLGYGVHWSSGQEVAFRLAAWTFALASCSELRNNQSLVQAVAESMIASAEHIEAYIDYARFAVHNNHLLSEAMGVLLVASLLPELEAAKRWDKLGIRLLNEGIRRQFYDDGGYIQQSHNYHRLALQVVLWARMLLTARKATVPSAWDEALRRSARFLSAQQNPADGRLPNYGANDGGLPLLLSSCDYSDFRPQLQAVSIATEGQRLYQPGPWDEEAAWLLGVARLDDAAQPSSAAGRRVSASFSISGHHVLRGEEPGSFCTLRCGSLRDRFSQIDMLHCDVWWRGNNIAVDGGSFDYNSSPTWHRHFYSAESHNTVMVDGSDQMLHYRQFKTLYWTQARLLEFRDQGGYAICGGEHYGFGREIAECVHRRFVLFAKQQDLWIVVDRVSASGTHRLRLHWLCGPYPHEVEADRRIRLATPEGAFSIATYDENAVALGFDLVHGQNEPPRGWLSRYYGSKRPVPSIVVERYVPLPCTWVSVLGAGDPVVRLAGQRWQVCTEAGTLSFRLDEGQARDIEILQLPSNNESRR